MDTIKKIDTIWFLFLLLGISSAAEHWNIPLDKYVFGAILLCLNVNGKYGNGGTNGGTSNGSGVVAGQDAPKA